MVLVCHPGHALAGHTSVSLTDLRGEPMVAFQAGLKIREEIDHALADEDVTVDVALEFDNIETMKRAIEIGAGVSLLPAPTVEREVGDGTLAKVALDDPTLVRPLGIIHRRDRKLSDTAERFIKLLQAAAVEANLAATNGHISWRVPRAPQTVN
jgi:DNA-binding transcriptional LysR family regulator